MLRVTSNALGLAALLSLAHCGARTGLREPDAATASDGSLDVAIDAEAAVPECATARDCDDTSACTDDRCVAGRCAHAPVDARCNDNVHCNGVERCVVGVGCAPGTPVACDDRVACTRDLCDEPTRTCRAAPDDALCPISHRCDLTRGCVARALANAAFKRDPSIDVSKNFEGAFGLFTTGERKHVVVDFDAAVAQYIEPREWHHSQRITRTDDGCLRVEFDVTNITEVVGWVLRWGANAVVREPPELVERVHAAHAKALARYAPAAS
jgi:hypothetical protein